VLVLPVSEIEKVKQLLELKILQQDDLNKKLQLHIKSIDEQLEKFRLFPKFQQELELLKSKQDSPDSGAKRKILAGIISAIIL
jgi:predicted RNA-binding protein with RPS1 domain